MSRGARAAEEATEDSLTIGLWDSRAGVQDGDLDLPFTRCRGDRDAPAHRSPRTRAYEFFAEGNPTNRKVALLTLRKLGYPSDVAANGAEVLAAFEQRPYDVVFIDVQMPDPDGLEATRQISQSRRPSTRGTAPRGGADGLLSAAERGPG